MTVPILPPEESHRAGISLVAALEARIEEARESSIRADMEGGSSMYHCFTGGLFVAFEEALELVRAASRGYGGD